MFTSCIPGMLLEVENLTDEPVLLTYYIKDAFIFDDPWEGFEQSVTKTVEPGEKAEIYFSWQKLANSGNVTAKDFLEIAIYTTLFEIFSVELLETNEEINIENRQYLFVKYRKNKTSHIYTIQIKRPNGSVP
jgi:hypothetical protein